MTLSAHEASLLQSCLAAIQEAYQSEILPPSVEAALYQPDSAKDLPDHQAVEYTQELRTFRGEHSKHIQRWIQSLANALIQSPVQWQLPAEEADLFLMIINDHRLYRAAEFNIADADMETPIDQISQPDKRIALLEIHFLAWFIELLLREM
ncbi:MAG: hypothetical protein ACOY3I_06720 [Verrucomicrobiota bacterium]